MREKEKEDIFFILIIVKVDKEVKVISVFPHDERVEFAVAG